MKEQLEKENVYDSKCTFRLNKLYMNTCEIGKFSRLETYHHDYLSYRAREPEYTSYCL